jgi:hypothetical protein
MFPLQHRSKYRQPKNAEKIISLVRYFLFADYKQRGSIILGIFGLIVYVI